MLVVFRIAAVRSDIGVFLNDPGPRLAGSIEKDAFTSLLCPRDFTGSRHVRCVTAPGGQERGPRYRVHDPAKRYAFLSGRADPQRMARHASSARYSQTIVAAASAVISATS